MSELEKMNRELAKCGYHFNQKKFLLEWISGLGKVPAVNTMELFEIASIYMVLAYKIGIDGGQLEDAFPFLEEAGARA